MSALPPHRVDALMGKIDAAVSSGGGGGGVGICTAISVAVSADKTSEGETEGGRRENALTPTTRADLHPNAASSASGIVPAVNESALLPKGGSPGGVSRGKGLVKGASNVGEEDRGAATANMTGLGPKVRGDPPRAIIGAALTIIELIRITVSRKAASLVRRVCCARTVLHRAPPKHHDTQWTIPGSLANVR